MKKLFFLSVLAFFFSFTALSQATWGGEAADTCIKDQTYTKTFSGAINGQPSHIIVTLDADSVSGNPKYTAKMQWSMDNSQWFDCIGLPTHTHNGVTGGDTVLYWNSYINLSDSGAYYTMPMGHPGKYYRVSVTGVDSTQKLKLSGTARIQRVY